MSINPPQAVESLVTPTRQVDPDAILKDDYAAGVPLLVDARPGHITLSRQCGLCGDVFQQQERCFALLGNSDSTLYWCNTLPFLYDASDREMPFASGSFEGWSLCQSRGCHHNQLDSEAVMMHTECFELFKQQRHCHEPGTMDQLWRFSAWRKPWKQAPSLLLPENRETISNASLATMAKVYGLPRLSDLPYEICSLIRQHSASALLWRFASVLDIATQLSVVTCHEPERMPLVSISWERGKRPVTGEPSIQNVLVTIDSRGIRNIERFEDGQHFNQGRSDKLVFMVHRASEPDLEVNFQDGMMRLQTSLPHPDLLICDTPDLLSLPIPRTRRNAISFYMASHFGTINLASVMGLTFLLDRRSEIYSVHGHTEQQPHAALPIEKLSDRDIEKLTWIYIPLGKGDRLTEIVKEPMSSSAEPPGIIVRTELAGTMPSGKWHLELLGHSIISDNYPRVLVFKVRAPGEEPFFTTYPQTAPSKGTLNLPQSSPPTLPFNYLRNRGRANLSSAPLAGVTCATVFRPLENEGWEDHCRGIIFKYENGAQRAVGECRLGYDRCDLYETPRIIRMNQTTQAWKVDFADKEIGEDVDSEDGWTPYQMKGVLHFWFLGPTNALEIVTE